MQPFRLSDVLMLSLALALVACNSINSFGQHRQDYQDDDYLEESSLPESSYEDTDDDFTKNYQSEKRNGRIIGGHPSIFRQWPMQIHLQAIEESFFFTHTASCGGTIIDNEFILTAAHCIGPRFDRYKILAGKTDLNEKEPGEQQREGQLAIRHPNYRENKFAYDIGLIKLDRPLEYSDSIYPAYLPEPNESLAERTETNIIGFGKIGPDEIPTKLYEAEVPVSNCLMFGHLVPDWQLICTKSYEENRSACDGDSGGPLLVRQNDWWVVHGVVSFGLDEAISCSEGSSAFTKVSAFIDWIKETMEQNRSKKLTKDEKRSHNESHKRRTIKNC